VKDKFYIFEPKPAARLLGFRARIPQDVWITFASVVSFQVEVSVTGRSLVQRSPTDCECVCVRERQRETVCVSESVVSVCVCL
jgi:adenine C2-methylase RlmN of 23S rRNA A2503 and tRNA A37